MAHASGVSGSFDLPLGALVKWGLARARCLQSAPIKWCLIAARLALSAVEIRSAPRFAYFPVLKICAWRRRQTSSGLKAAMNPWACGDPNDSAMAFARRRLPIGRTRSWPIQASFEASLDCPLNCHALKIASGEKLLRSVSFITSVWEFVLLYQLIGMNIVSWGWNLALGARPSKPNSWPSKNENGYFHASTCGKKSHRVVAWIQAKTVARVERFVGALCSREREMRWGGSLKCRGSGFGARCWRSLWLPSWRLFLAWSPRAKRRSRASARHRSLTTEALQIRSMLGAGGMVRLRALIGMRPDASSGHWEGSEWLASASCGIVSRRVGCGGRLARGGRVLRKLKKRKLESSDGPWNRMAPLRCGIEGARMKLAYHAVVNAMEARSGWTPNPGFAASVAHVVDGHLPYQRYYKAGTSRRADGAREGVVERLISEWMATDLNPAVQIIGNLKRRSSAIECYNAYNASTQLGVRTSIAMPEGGGRLVVRRDVGTNESDPDLCRQGALMILEGLMARDRARLRGWAE